jgi:quinol monooxygenase YgiN
MARAADGFIFLVEFRLTPGAQAKFLELITENANASVRDEPGCRRFDVMTPLQRGDSFILYEIYDDRAAFEAHLRTPHFARFKEASAPLIAGQTLTECRLEAVGH